VLSNPALGFAPPIPEQEQADVRFATAA
jgi:hypothetical protein